MKRLIILLFSILFLCLNVQADDSLDVDYNFIDTAFDGIKPVTSKEFNDTVNRLTPQPIENTLGGKIKAFLFGRKYGVEEPPKGQDKEIDIGGELKAIQEIKNGVYYVRIVAPIIALEGQVIPLGDYKIKEKNIDNESRLIFYQGSKEYGSLKLKSFEDTLKNENDIAYSRVDIVSDSILRIVYSTLEETKCAYAKVYSGD